eukprot:3257459-Alexandrium_andersonii.AAC.1
MDARCPVSQTGQRPRCLGLLLSHQSPTSRCGFTLQRDVLVWMPRVEFDLPHPEHGCVEPVFGASG